MELLDKIKKWFNGYIKFTKVVSLDKEDTARTLNEKEEAVKLFEEEKKSDNNKLKEKK